MIKIGIIGAGVMAQAHAHYFHTTGRSEVVFVADPVLERAQALADECGAKAVGDYRNAIAEADAVVVASPNFLHHEQALEVVRAGRHLYCEKPMGLSADQARDIANAVNEAGVKSQVGFSVRFDPTIQTMIRYEREGALGEIISMCSRRLCYLNPDNAPAWRRDHNLSGGLLMEINIHELEWMMYIGGEVESVYARTWAAKPDSERSNDHMWVTLNFTKGATAIHEGSWLSATAAYYRNVQGTKGGMSTDEWGSHVQFSRVDEDRNVVELEPAFDLRGNFLDSMGGVAESTADVNYALKVMLVAEAVLKSAHTGEVVPMSTV